MKKLSNDELFKIISKFRGRTVAGVILPSNKEKLQSISFIFTDGTSISISVPSISEVTFAMSVKDID